MNFNSYVSGASQLSVVLVVYSLHSSFVCVEVRLIIGLTTIRVVGGKVGIIIHKNTIMLLILRVKVDGPNILRLDNKLNTQVVLFPNPIKLNFHGQLVLN